MIRALTSLVLAASVAVSPLGARPAQALDEKDLLGLLAGAAAIAIIKKELDDRKEKERAAQVRRQQTPRYSDTWSYRNRVLPARCSFRLEDRRGRIRNVVGPRCLERQGVRLARLPDNCLREVRTTRGWRNAYGLRCLKKNGWSLDGHRDAGAQRKAPRHDDGWPRQNRILPGQCQFRLEDRSGQLRRVVGPRCLERNGVRTSRLPDRCLREVRTTRGWRDAYGLRCLTRAGWELNGTRRIGN